MLICSALCVLQYEAQRIPALRSQCAHAQQQIIGMLTTILRSRLMQICCTVKTRSSQGTIPEELQGFSARPGPSM